MVSLQQWVKVRTATAVRLRSGQDGSDSTAALLL